VAVDPHLGATACAPHEPLQQGGTGAGRAAGVEAKPILVQALAVREIFLPGEVALMMALETHRPGFGRAKARPRLAGLGIAAARVVLALAVDVSPR